MHFVKLLSKLVVSDKPYSSLQQQTASLQTIKWHQLTKKNDSSSNPSAQLEFVQCAHQLPPGVLRKMMCQRDILPRLRVAE